MHHNRAFFWFRFLLENARPGKVNDCVAAGIAIAMTSGLMEIQGVTTAAVSMQRRVVRYHNNQHVTPTGK